MKKEKSISNNNIYVTSERNHSTKSSSEYSYNLSYEGTYVLYEMSADEVREMIACLQYALSATEEGGEK